MGADDHWFQVTRRTTDASPLRLIFFGLHTPLQGAPVIGAAIAALDPERAVEITMVGVGQDRAKTESLVGAAGRVTWIDWAEPADLLDLVAAHHVCLGIFGDTPKAQRVTPNQAFQGASAGCTIVTSEHTAAATSPR